MQKSVLLLFFILVISWSCSTQNKEDATQKTNAVQIGLTVKGWENQKVLVESRSGKKTTTLDTLTTDKNGHAVFNHAPLPGGLYLFTFPEKRWFIEYIIDDDNQQFSITTDTTDFFHHIKVKKSKENKALFEYQLDVYNLRRLSRKYTILYRKNIKNADSTKKYKELYENLSKDYQKKLKEYTRKYKGTFLATIINVSKEVTVPAPPHLDTVSEDRKNVYIAEFRYQYLQEHFFDNVDFSDTRLIHTSILTNKISEYYGKIVSTKPDTLIKVTENLLSKISNEEVYRFVFSFILSNVERGGKWYSEALFLHLASNYVLAGKTPWLSKAQQAQVKFQYSEMAPTITGRPFPTLELTNVLNKQKFVVDDIHAPITIVYFWSDQCGHCKRFTPGFHELYQKYRKKGMMVVAVTATNDFRNWVKYFVKKKYTDWLNAYYEGDYNRLLHLYNIYMTPHTFVLDKNKIIIKKDPTLQELEEILKQRLDK